MNNDSNPMDSGSDESVEASAPNSEPTVGIVDKAENASLFSKYPALKVVGGVAAIVLFLGGAIALRNNINVDSKNSSASCYGYNCAPSVVIGGRVVTTGYQTNPISYGTLNIKSGETIELTWSGSNVDRCEADWTRFRGTYMPLTIYGKVTQTQNFEVTCYTNKQRVKGTLAVRVLNGDR